MSHLRRESLSPAHALLIAASSPAPEKHRAKLLPRARTRGTWRGPRVPGSVRSQQPGLHKIAFCTRVPKAGAGHRAYTLPGFSHRQYSWGITGKGREGRDPSLVVCASRLPKILRVPIINLYSFFKAHDDKIKIKNQLRFKKPLSPY